MKKIYILLMHTKTIPAKLVKLFTNYPYSHVGLSLERSCNVIYSFGRTQARSIWHGGFSIVYRHGEFFKIFPQTVCKIYEVEVTNEQYAIVKNLLEEMNSQEYKYDYLGLFPRYFGIPFRLKNRYVCSYFVAYVLEKANIHHFSKDAWMIRPQDFENLEGFQEIYVGDYALYR